MIFRSIFKGFSDLETCMGYYCQEEDVKVWILFPRPNSLAIRTEKPV